MTNHIELAVQPMRQRSIDNAVTFMQSKIDRTLERLAEVGMDAHILAPYPNSNMNRTAYMTKKAWYEFVTRITKDDANARNTHRRDAPRIVERDEVGIARLLKEVAEDASGAFDAYVYKLNSKVGEVTGAEVTTPWDLWYDSNLRVTKADGTIENWKTKCITNFSKYNKAFNQFPTRKSK